MKELLISQIAPIAATAIVAILVKLVYTIGDAAIQLFLKLKEEAEQIIKSSGHEEDLKTAKEAWNAIEEKFRITENATQVLGSKADMFDKLLLNKIPGLTQTNLDDLRQAIAGEVNKGKTVIIADTSVQQIATLTETNAQLEADKAALQAKIDAINSALNPATIIV